MMRSRLGGGAVSAALLAAVLGLLVLQASGRWAGHSGAASAIPPYPLQGGTPRVGLGVTTPALARNSSRRWRSGDLQQVNAFEQRARRHADIVMWFADWAHVADFDARQAAAVAQRGSVPEIAWEPWDSTKPLEAPQPRYRLARIIAGAFDAYIARWAREIAAYGGPVRIRFAQEMNGRWFPWAEKANGNRRGQFVAAWRHVHAIFTRAGAHNVRWVWAAVDGNIDPGEYPGDHEVDIVGVTGFNAGPSVFGGRWRSFAAEFGPSLTALHALAPDKPVELSEVACAERGGDKARWITGMFRDIQRRPYVHGLVWFDVRKEADWRINSSLGAQRAFAGGLSRVAR